jgi:hypothetical protein
MRVAEIIENGIEGKDRGREEDRTAGGRRGGGIPDQLLVPGRSGENGEPVNCAAFALAENAQQGVGQWARRGSGGGGGEGGAKGEAGGASLGAGSELDSEVGVSNSITAGAARGVEAAHGGADGEGTGVIRSTTAGEWQSDDAAGGPEPKVSATGSGRWW